MRKVRHGHKADLTLEEAKKEYEIVRERFELVKKIYPGNPRAIISDDHDTLIKCLGVLMPLKRELSVQNQAIEGMQNDNYGFTLHNRIGILEYVIQEYLISF